MYGLVRPNRIYADWYDVQVPIYENDLFHTSTPNHSSSKLSLQHSIHPRYRIQNSPHRTRGNQPRDSNRTQLHQQTGKGGVAYSGAITTTGRGRAGTEARRSLRQSRLRQKGGVKRTGTTGELAPNESHTTKRECSRGSPNSDGLVHSLRSKKRRHGN